MIHMAEVTKIIPLLNSVYVWVMCYTQLSPGQPYGQSLTRWLELF